VIEFRTPKPWSVLENSTRPLWRPLRCPVFDHGFRKRARK